MAEEGWLLNHQWQGCLTVMLQCRDPTRRVYLIIVVPAQGKHSCFATLSTLLCRLLGPSTNSAVSTRVF